MKWVKRIIVAILLGVFLFSAGIIGVVIYQYHVNDEAYANAAERFITPAGVISSSGQQNMNDDPQNSASGESNVSDTAVETEAELAPFSVDFDALREVNPDVTGWIYCEDTTINYPVLQGATNDTYLRHLYDGSYCYGGSIFVEAQNSKDFADYNTIIYGHNMRDDSMFGTLERWADQKFYEAHPVIWLLTPERDYRIEILSAYTTSAYSDTYQIFAAPGAALDAYLEQVLSQSEIAPRDAPETGSRYVLLSTCAYVFDNARFVIHGKLVPVDSAAGVYREKNEP